MPHDEQNQHQCTACLICMTNCPNGTIQITTRKEVDEETGKEKKVLDTYWQIEAENNPSVALPLSEAPEPAASQTTNLEPQP